MKTFREFLDDRKIDEGIDIDRENRVVLINDGHEEYVDTSVYANPTEYNYKGLDVISIFKRKRGESQGDGNPLIYALKGSNNWSIDDKNRIKLYKQFVKISKKIDRKFDTIVLVPSSNKLNRDFSKKVSKLIQCDIVLNDVITKMCSEEVLDLGYEYQDEKTHKIVMKAFNRMDSIFSFSKIPVEVRHLFPNTMETGELYHEEINGKDILLIDDTITTGSSILESAKIIKENYVPKSVTVLSLFSILKD